MRLNFYLCINNYIEPNWGPKRRAGRAEKTATNTDSTAAVGAVEEGEEQEREASSSPAAKKPKN